MEMPGSLRHPVEERGEDETWRNESTTIYCEVSEKVQLAHQTMG